MTCYFSIDDYAKDGRLLCSFYHEPVQSLIVKKTSITLHLHSDSFQIEHRDSVKPFEANLSISALWPIIHESYDRKGSR